MIIKLPMDVLLAVSISAIGDSHAIIDLVFIQQLSILKKDNRRVTFGQAWPFKI